MVSTGKVMEHLPGLENVNNKLLKMAIEIVDFPINIAIYSGLSH